MLERTLSKTYSTHAHEETRSPASMGHSSGPGRYFDSQVQDEFPAAKTNLTEQIEKTKILRSRRIHHSQAVRNKGEPLGEDNNPGFIFHDSEIRPPLSAPPFASRSLVSHSLTPTGSVMGDFRVPTTPSVMALDHVSVYIFPIR